MHRLPDPEKMSLEEMAKIFGELIKKGKIKGWGISQATSEEIERCNAVTPLTCVQNEYSMMERMYEKEIKTCEKLGISFVVLAQWLLDFYQENIIKILNMKVMTLEELLQDSKQIML